MSTLVDETRRGVGPSGSNEARPPLAPRRASGAVQLITPFPGDLGKTYDVNGQGPVAPLGLVHFTATITTPGIYQSGRATGTLILTNALGSVTLSLVGPQQPGSPPCPTISSSPSQTRPGRSRR